MQKSKEPSILSKMKVKFNVPSFDYLMELKSKKDELLALDNWNTTITRIEINAEQGKTEATSNTHLTEDEVKELTDKGYKVIKVDMFHIISWNHILNAQSDREFDREIDDDIHD